MRETLWSSIEVIYGKVVDSAVDISYTSRIAVGILEYFAVETVEYSTVSRYIDCGFPVGVTR